MEKLLNVRVAILTEEGFEEVELTSPKEALEKAGARVEIISTKTGKIKAWDKTNWGIEIKVDKALADVKIEDYDALVLPGGVMNPDKLRLNKDAVKFAGDFLMSGKPLAAICHGPQTLIETGMLEGRKMTSFPSLKTDLTNAGAKWADKEMVQDDNLITSRKPADLPAFNKALIGALTLQHHQ
ncbi:MAG: type 1 glutamine amidotransferase [Taibaiella sp.]|nr:type 1 glutamine amidotransferase [Taibaiella sp.]